MHLSLKQIFIPCSHAHLSNSCQLETAINEEQQRLFKCFNYIHPDHFHMFEQRNIISSTTLKNSASTNRLVASGLSYSSSTKFKKVHVAERPSPSSSSFCTGNKTAALFPNRFVSGALPTISLKGGGSTIAKPKVFF